MTAEEQRKSDLMHGLTDLLLKAGVLTVAGRERDGDLVDVECKGTVDGAEAMDKLLQYLSMHTCFKHIYSRSEEFVDQLRLEPDTDPFATDGEILAAAALLAAEEKMFIED
jgi:hypothetical protein